MFFNSIGVCAGKFNCFSYEKKSGVLIKCKFPKRRLMTTSIFSSGFEAVAYHAAYEDECHDRFDSVLSVF